jgi:DNA repair protein RadC
VELLELLLAFALPRIDTKPLAKELLRRCGGLWGLFGATEADLEDVKGIGPKAATLIRLVHELACACLLEGSAKRDAVKSPQAVADYLRLKLAGCGDEVVLLLLLDARNHIIGEEVISEGTPARATVEPRKIVEKALARKAVGFILAHNHPSGSVDPSPEDDALTQKVRAAAETVDIKMIDHVIVGRAGWWSYRAERDLSSK